MRGGDRGPRAPGPLRSGLLFPVLEHVAVVGKHVRRFDQRTLRAVSPLPLLGRADLLAVSPDGEYAALRTDGAVEVRDLGVHRLGELASRPMAGAGVADLKTAAAMTSHRGAAVSDLAELLTMCLEYRFGAEIALGDTTRPQLGDTDIQLA